MKWFMHLCLLNCLLTCLLSVPLVAGAQMKKPHSIEKHGDTRVDNYFWMKERDSKPVLDFLKAENKRALDTLKPHKALEKMIFEEMKSRMNKDESSVPVKNGGYFYYVRYVKNKEYPLHCRRKGTMSAPEEILLDENKEAKGADYYDASRIEPSPDHSRYLYAVDSVGRRFYDLYVFDLKSKKKTKVVTNATPSFTWAEDGKTIFYVKQDPDTLRAYQLYRIDIDTENEPTLVYEEKDTTFDIGVSKSRTKRFIFMGSSTRDSSEWHFIDAKTPKAKWEIFQPREANHEYGIEDSGKEFLILTNWKASEFRLMSASPSARKKEAWTEIIPERKGVHLQSVDAYETFWVLAEREKGLTQIRLFDPKTKTSRVLGFEDEAYMVSPMGLPEFEESQVRFLYTSLLQPYTVFEEDVNTKDRKTLKVDQVPGYDSSLYTTRRLWATAKDGVKVPISVIYKKTTPLDGTAPGLLYGYGSYGLASEPGFDETIFSLVDRGYIYAMAHIRGGSEMGRAWYDQGRLENKMNTFTDFIAAGDHLIQQKFVAAGHLAAQGGSAGGLLMGAVINLKPELFKSILAEVPYVDALTTMLDDTIPLTTSEYREWGNPNDKKFYDVIKSYSPYDNVTAKAYPHIFVTTGYHDSQVQYWEPAKWVAKLRELKTDQNLLLFYTDLKAGHSGASGRFEYLKQLAREWTFILKADQL